MRNTTTDQVVYEYNRRFDPAIEGALGAGLSRDRVHSFDWPVGTQGIGDFSFEVRGDGSDEIFENNAANNAEDNNSDSVIAHSAPDLVVRNLRVHQTSLEAGGLVTLLWEDWNLGVAATPIGFSRPHPRHQLTTGTTLLDTRLAYDPTQAGDGPIGTNEFRPRTVSFRLPEGVNGAGTLQIHRDHRPHGFDRVALSSNAAALQQAEGNNLFSIERTSIGRAYANLAVESVSVPTSGHRRQ